MKLTTIVCVKQVPDVLEVKIDPETKTLLRQGVPSILNPFDEFAVEEALRLRETFGGKVIAVSMGPSQAEEALRTCLDFGADEAVLLSDPLLSGSDTLATATALSAVLRKISFDLVICGQETTDSSTAQVGPEIAEELKIPQVTFVNKVELSDHGGEGRFWRETDTGYQIVSGKLPLLITVVKGINVPRSITTCPANARKVTRYSAADVGLDKSMIGLDGSPTRVVGIAYTHARSRAQTVIDSTLPAMGRIKSIMNGGLAQRDKSVVLRQVQVSSIDAVIRVIRDGIRR